MKEMLIQASEMSLSVHESADMELVEAPIAFYQIMTLINVGWSVAVIVMLYKIWKKVRHLPG